MLYLFEFRLVAEIMDEILDINVKEKIYINYRRESSIHLLTYTSLTYSFLVLLQIFAHENT